MSQRAKTAGSLAKQEPLINPPGETLGRANAILTGSGKDYFVPDFEGSLSIKTVVSGSAVWEAGGRRFQVHENTYLILNDRQRYTMTIDSTSAVTTFCIFFERGFVEDVFRATAKPADELLENRGDANALPLHFFEKLEPQDSPVLGRVRKLRERLLREGGSALASQGDFYSVAAAMVREHQNTASAISKLPALRPSTRWELYKRLLRGRDALLSSLDSQVALKEVARAACLSPYHFHRAFSQAFGLTPHQYLTRHRLARAAHLLRGSGRSVTEICFEAGFESPGSFSTLFRRYFGLSPREFRQQHLSLCDLAGGRSRLHTPSRNPSLGDYNATRNGR